MPDTSPEAVAAAVKAAIKGIWQQAIGLYEQYGSEATLALGEALELPFSYCQPCDNDTATLEGCCLTCSSEKPAPGHH